MELALKSGDSVLFDIIAQAMKDDEFRSQLIRNPKEILEKATGVSLPAGIDVEVLQETENKIYLVIPSEPIIEDPAVNDRIFESVAGLEANSQANCTVTDCGGCT